MGSAGLTVQLSDALRPVIHYDFTREGMAALIRALTNEGFRIDEDLLTYRYKGSIEPDARRAYASTMGWVKAQGGLFYDEDFIRKVNVPTLVVNGKNDKVVPTGVALRFLDLIPRSWGYIIPALRPLGDARALRGLRDHHAELPARPRTSAVDPQPAATSQVRLMPAADIPPARSSAGPCRGGVRSPSTTSTARSS